MQYEQDTTVIYKSTNETRSAASTSYFQAIKCLAECFGYFSIVADDNGRIECFNWLFKTVTSALFQIHEAIRFLEFCIRSLKNKDQAIHNYPISLYADFDVDKLFQYLKVQGQVCTFIHSFTGIFTEHTHTHTRGYIRQAFCHFILQVQHV